MQIDRETAAVLILVGVALVIFAVGVFVGWML